ncbi:AAA domain-containing protein [Roseateles sp. BYS78W]|uniref:AAA domain-containing protein n=1 Tax=Pelomonas candidula TaxID=3299025 RepID=A0ABW7HI85_9BURK
MSIKRNRQVDIGNEALARLGFPPAEELLADSALWPDLSVLAQVLSKFSAGGQPNNYLSDRLPDATKRLGNQASSAAKPVEQPSALNVAAWLAWIEGWPTTAAARTRAAAEAQSRQQALQTARENAPPLLKLSLELARFEDQDAVARCEPLAVAPLREVRAAPPGVHPGVDSVLLVFGVRKPAVRSGSPFRVFFTIRLVHPEGQPRYVDDTTWTLDGKPCYVPPDDPQLQFSSSEFFRDGEPVGEFDEDSLARIAADPWPDEARIDWPGFIAELDRRCVEALGHRMHEFAPALFGRHVRDIEVRVVDEARVQPSPWCAVLQELVDGARESALPLSLLQSPEVLDLVRLSTSPRERFLGHMDASGVGTASRKPAFPLDCTQRLAAMQAMVLEPTQGRFHLPVNGPPGSGKTSFLKALLASQWVLAAVEQRGSPPLVFGTGATNKAVINVIEAFGDVVGTDSYSMEARWVDGLPSYGWFFPSSKAAEDYPNLMQLRYDAATHQPYRPSGAAQAFSDIDAEQHRDQYLERASKVLRLGGSSSLSLDSVAGVLHDRLVRHRDAMALEIRSFESALSRVGDAFAASRARAGDILRLTNAAGILEAEFKASSTRVAQLSEANRLGRAYRVASRRLLAGWRSWLPRAIRERLFGKEIADLAATETYASVAFGSAGLEWTRVWPLLDEALSKAESLWASEQQRHDAASQAKQLAADELTRALQRRAERREAVRSLISQTAAPKRLAPSELPTARYAVALTRNLPSRAGLAIDMLWARFDARQDLEHRVAMFHLAARYWEGRWISEALRDDIDISNEARLRRAMMLGVIIVATTHQVCKLGKDATADLLVMDEAGQCLPVVALSASACANTAIFVGDTKQLQPINLLTSDRVEQIARRCGLTPADVPDALNPCTGSGMALAKHGAHWTDGRGEAGVTLLYHYRCHPLIAGYCSELLYGSALRYVRADEPTAFSEPPMAWVDVDLGPPARRGNSWINPFEARAIVDWIEQIHDRLAAAYGKPLDEILAIITPLAGQAACIKEELAKRLGRVLGTEVLDRLIIGTVHRLQGAERPVVAFSLVQQLGTNPRLFADRDGGFLMNVAVSRAKDCFVVFGQRQTFWPGPTDAREAARSGLKRTPMARLGAYMRKHGRRLFPKHLVVVEAPGKVQLVSKALGLQVAIVATQGMLQDSSLSEDGTLQWAATDERAMESFLGALSSHRGLIESLVIATDDDLAGELIGWQTAELAASILGDVQVKRMRFHTLVDDDLRLALEIAGPDFDADLLTAALVREYARHMDRRVFKAKLPDQTYQSASRRAIVAIADEIAPEDSYCVEVVAADRDGQHHHGFVAADVSALAGPARMRLEEARAVAQGLLNLEEANAMTVTLSPVNVEAVLQVPPLYPPSTTLRVLEVAADELNIMPWDAQAEMNALYQQGSDT